VKDKNPNRFVILSTVILVRSCIGLIWASAGPLLPLIMQAYGISRGSAGWFASSAPLAIAIVCVPIGIITARFSLKKTFAVGAFLQGGGILAPFCTSYLPLLLTRVCFAIGTAVTVPVATAIAAEWFTNRELPLVNGITMSFVNLGNAIAFVATVPIATVLSWKAPITIYGAVALTCATAWTIFGRDRRGARILGEDTRAPALKTKAELTIRQALTQRSTILLTLAVTGAWCLGNAIGSWLPTYYHEIFKMPLEKASSITAIITGAGTLACLAGGILPARLGRRKPFLIVPGVFIGLSALSSVLFNNPVVIYLSIALFGVFSNLQAPMLFTIPMELPDASPRTGAIIISVMQCGGNLGNFMGPLIVGYLTDITGSYLPGFIICAVISLGLLVAGLLLPETGPKARRL
jgi:NNP family nitrate/nitrite transporter-like MFS transporter